MYCLIMTNFGRNLLKQILNNKNIFFIDGFNLTCYPIVFNLLQFLLDGVSFNSLKTDIHPNRVESICFFLPDKTV